MNLGYLAYQRDDLDEALQWLEHAETLAIESNMSLISEWWQSRGSILHQRGRLVEARAAFHTAIAMAQDLGQVVFAATPQARLAAVARSEGRLDEAADLIQQALAVASARGIDRLEADVSNEAAMLSLAAGEPLQALVHAGRAYDLAVRVGSRWSEVIALIRLASAHQALGHDPETSANGREALTIATEIGYAGLARDAAAVLAELPPA